MKLTKIAGLLVVLVALAAGLVLVRQTQETRRGAAFAEVEALFLPESRKVKLGEEFVSTFVLDAKSSKLTGVDVKLKYDRVKLKVKEVKLVLTGSGAGTALFGAETDVLDKAIDEGKGLINLVGISMEEDETKMPMGIVNLVKITFEAIAEGNAEVTLDGSYGNMVAGYNPSSTDQNLEIKTVKKAIYAIGAVGGITPTVVGATITVKPTVLPMPTTVSCVWCGRACVPGPVKYPCPDVMPPAGSKCVLQKGVCTVLSSGVSPTPGMAGCNGRCTATVKCAAGLSCVPIWWSGTCPEMPTQILEKLNQGGLLTIAERQQLISLCPNSAEVLAPTGTMTSKTAEAVVAMIGSCRNKVCPKSTNCICGGAVVATPTLSQNLNPPLCASSTIPPESGGAPLAVTFHGAGNAGAGPGFDGYQWDFNGDGKWDTEVRLDPYVYTYQNSGVYNPKYRIRGTNGVWSEICKYPYKVVVGAVSTPKATNAPLLGKCKMCQAGVKGKNVGNANCDEKIDLVDFERWRKEAFDDGGINGKVRSDWGADFNCDQKVNLADFEVWRSNYFK